jgi:hypothetical protein
VLTFSSFATSGIFKSDESMKAYLADYLRSRDIYDYERFLRDLSGAAGGIEWIIRTTLPLCMKELTERFPSLTEGEMLRISSQTGR